MSFKVLTEYLEFIESFPLADSRIGLLAKGRYSGFDTLISAVGGGDIPVKLTHTATGVQATDSDNLITSKTGTVLSPHGVVIKTSDEVALGITKNLTAYDRYDLIYLEYHWISDTPGYIPSIAIQQGVAGSGEPILTDQTVNTLLGIITIPAGATTFAQISYQPSQIPLPGGANIITNFPELDGRFARLDYPNRLTGLQSDNLVIITIPDGDFMGDLVIPNTANTIMMVNNAGGRLLLGGITLAGGELLPLGTQINLIFWGISQGSFADTGAGGYGTQQFRLNPYPLSDWDMPTLFPINNTDAITVVFKGFYWGKQSWEIISAPGFFNASIRDLKKRVDGLLSPKPWQKVTLPPGSFTFYMGFLDNLNNLSYRLNNLGQTEIRGRFNKTNADGGFFLGEVCKINPAFTPRGISPLVFTGEGLVPSADTVVHGWLGDDGMVHMASSPIGWYSINMVLAPST